MKVLALLLVALVATGVAYGDDDTDYYAELTGDKQTTPIDTSTKAWIYFDIHDGDDLVEWNIHIEAVEDLLMGHIHLGGPTVNGPVVVGLIPVGAPVSAFANGSLPKLSKPASGDLHYAGVFSADDFVGNWTGKPLSTAISAFNSNKAYVNLHTTAYPAGVVRGQIVPEND